MRPGEQVRARLAERESRTEVASLELDASLRVRPESPIRVGKTSIERVTPG